MMKKVFVIALILGAYILMEGQTPNSAESAENTAEHHFRVLSPWAETDPVIPRGISPRVNSLAGKKIGLFSNFKRASKPIVEEVGKRLKRTYPGCELSFFDSPGANVLETETQNREKFISWLKGVDAVVLAVGD